MPTLWLGALTGSFLAGGWALGRTLPLRAFDGLYLIFLAGWFATLFVFIRSTPGSSTGGPAFLRVAAAAVLALGMLLSTNVKLGLRDLGGSSRQPQVAHGAREHDELTRGADLDPLAGKKLLELGPQLDVGG